MIAPLFGSITRPLLSPLVSGLRDELFGAFTPRSLFNDGSIGVLYDNNDLTTMFVDTAGTTPATVNGLVGLQLDNSRSLAIGSEIVPNGTFDSATGWTVPAGWTISAGVATASATGSSLLQSTAPATSGIWYKVEFDWTHVGGTLFVRMGTGQAATFTSSGRKVCYLLSNGTGGVDFYGGSVSGTLDNVTAKPISGNHRYQATTGSKPILRGTPTGSNLVTNGDFASGTGWTLNAAASITGGQLVFDGVTSLAPTVVLAEPSTPLSVTIGKVYRVTYTIIAGAAFNGISVSIGGTNGTARTSAGTYVEYITAATTGNFQIITRGSTGVRACSVDNVEVVDVSAGSVTAPYGLQYDGVDDFLQTASVNFSATDKMFVCAGVRKLSDAARGMLIELGNVPGTNTFRIEAPPAVVPAYTIISGGSALASLQSASSFAAPITNVLSGLMDISGDSLRLRLNGSEQTPVSTDQGTGNFGNYPLFIGRRGGTSLPYNGLDFGFVIVGKTLTAAQISSTERYIAQRTGVSI